MSPRRRRGLPIPDAILDRLPRSPVNGATFMEGLALGALIGAAIAGSTVWQRARARSAARRTWTIKGLDAVMPADPLSSRTESRP